MTTGEQISRVNEAEATLHAVHRTAPLRLFAVLILCGLWCSPLAPAAASPDSSVAARRVGGNANWPTDKFTQDPGHDFDSMQPPAGEPGAILAGNAPVNGAVNGAVPESLPPALQPRVSGGSPGSIGNAYEDSSSTDEQYTPDDADAADAPDETGEDLEAVQARTDEIKDELDGEIEEMTQAEELDAVIQHHTQEQDPRAALSDEPQQGDEGAAAPAQITPGTIRRRPGHDGRPTKFEPYVYESIPDINSSAPDFKSIFNRWNMFYAGKWYDPYNQNILKGDLPVFGKPGEEWFIVISAMSDTTIERRKLPTPVGFASTDNSGSDDTFGNFLQTSVSETIVPSFSLIRGNTTFRPPDFELRVTPAINVNHADIDEQGALNIDPAHGTKRNDAHVGFNELFVDYHIANLSDRYDFVSTRVGIQNFNADFRGFVYHDQQPGVRVFGNYDNNKTQYNLAYFDRLDKDTNSGINTTFDPRHEDVVIANLYRQDAFTQGHQIQGVVIYRDDRAGDEVAHYDQNGFLVRPAAIGDEQPTNVYSTYLGFNTDGHIKRINITSALYYVFGSESHNPIAERSVEISAGMAALELSYDSDWIRYRASGFWSSGDRDPFDGHGGGFDSVFDTPNFAGGDLAYFQHEGIPFIAGGGVNLVNPHSFLPSLKPGALEGQSNFVNPGLRLLNLGVDFDVLPTLRLISNASYLQFDNTASLEALRQDGSISREIGYDLSLGANYRPFLNNNVQFHFGAAMLIPGDGLKNLYGDRVLYDMFSNVILLY